jgi:DNA adenine methylase
MDTNRYNGGKNGSGTYQQIINCIPEHKYYFELFLGSGAILKNKIPADISICMDMDQEVINSLDITFCKPGCIYKCGDAISFLESSSDLLQLIHETTGKVFIYLDPPYPFFTRVSKARLYKYELADCSHLRLLKICSILKIPVAISSYKNEMYDEHLEGWNFIEFPSMTRQGVKMECLYMNYPLPEKLHDYRYIGNTFREREKLKIIKNNVLAKFDRLPDRLRNSIIQELINKTQL